MDSDLKSKADHDKDSSNIVSESPRMPKQHNDDQSDELKKIEFDSESRESTHYDAVEENKPKSTISSAWFSSVMTNLRNGEFSAHPAARKAPLREQTQSLMWPQDAQMTAGDSDVESVISNDSGLVEMDAASKAVEDEAFEDIKAQVEINTIRIQLQDYTDTMLQIMDNIPVMGAVDIHEQMDTVQQVSRKVAALFNDNIPSMIEQIAIFKKSSSFHIARIQDLEGHRKDDFRVIRALRDECSSLRASMAAGEEQQTFLKSALKSAVTRISEASAQHKNKVEEMSKDFERFSNDAWRKHDEVLDKAKQQMRMQAKLDLESLESKQKAQLASIADHHRSTLSQKNQRIEQLEEALNNCKDTKLRYGKALAEAREDLRGLGKEHKAKIASIENRHSSAISEKVEDIEQLKKTLVQSNDAIGEYEEAFKNAKEDIKVLQSRQNAQITLIENCHDSMSSKRVEEIERLKEIIQGIETSSSEQRKKDGESLFSAQEAISDLEKRLDDMTKSVQHLKLEAEGLTLERDRVQRTNNLLTSAAEKAANDIVSLTKANDIAKRQVKRLGRDLGLLYEKHDCEMANHEKTNGQLAAAKILLEKNIKSLEHDYSLQTQELEKTRKILKTGLKENNEFKLQLQDCRTAMDNETKESPKLHAKLAAAKKENESLSSSLLEAETRIRVLEEDSETVERTLKELRQSLKEAHKASYSFITGPYRKFVDSFSSASGPKFWQIDLDGFNSQIERAFAHPYEITEEWFNSFQNFCAASERKAVHQAAKTLLVDKELRVKDQSALVKQLKEQLSKVTKGGAVRFTAVDALTEQLEQIGAEQKTMTVELQERRMPLYEKEAKSLRMQIAQLKAQRDYKETEARCVRHSLDERSEQLKTLEKELKKTKEKLTAATAQKESVKEQFQHESLELEKKLRAAGMIVEKSQNGVKKSDMSIPEAVSDLESPAAPRDYFNVTEEEKDIPKPKLENLNAAASCS